jgi:hypothetical protein
MTIKPSARPAPPTAITLLALIARTRTAIRESNPTAPARMDSAAGRRITDPARMLAGYAYDPPAPARRCYVIGCWDLDTQPARHKVFGDVDACETHHPRRSGYEPETLPAVAAPPAAAQDTQPPTRASQDDPRDDGGARVPRRPIPSGPSSPDALEEPRTRQPEPIAPTRITNNPPVRPASVLGF